MAFCTNCGTQASSSFCPKCGSPIAGSAPAPQAPPLQPPPPPPPQAQQQYYPPQPSHPVGMPVEGLPGQSKKKTSPWVWILGGLGVFFLLIIVAVVGAGFFVAKKVKDAGIDTALMEKNPALATAKMMMAMNPDVEIVKIDEDAGILTIREKKTGKTITMNAQDIKDGKISFHDDASGEGVTFGAGKDAKLPSWIPSYPGTTPQSAVTSTGRKSGGMATFTTDDPANKVITYLESEMKSSGMKVSKTILSETGENAGGMVSGEDTANSRTVAFTVSTTNGQTHVAITYGEK